MPNIVAAPRFWRNKAVLIKLETAYGQDAVPAGAINWIEARNVSLTPMDADKVERNIDLPYMGSSGNIIVSAWSKLSFDVALAPSGTVATAPKWGPLMLACGMAQTITASVSVAYNLVSQNFSSLTGYIVMDGTLHKLVGMRGEMKGKMSAKGTPMLSLSFDSVYTAPVAGPMPAINRTGWTIEEGVNSTNTGPAKINGVSLAFSQLDWALGNKISRIDLPGPQVEVAITNRAVSGSITVLAPDLAAFDPFALSRAGTTVTLNATHGLSAGMKTAVDMKTRIVGVEYDKIDEMLAYKLTLDAPPVAGNDEFAMTLT
ncbi:phage tail tube protein [Massilia sp. NR 4-1]|uniref:phage tail tube protein n=1 Tax=Massilia sp. NR 4-1 TaxID=1678028 RepID=UPI00067DEEAB|nr:phage tail tube protein [Massilia sp. NR 4-1]